MTSKLKHTAFIVAILLAGAGLAAVLHHYAPETMALIGDRLGDGF